MKRHTIEVSDSLRIVVGPGIIKTGRGKNAEWVDDKSKIRISTEYQRKGDPTWHPGRGGIQFEPGNGDVDALYKALKTFERTEEPEIESEFSFSMDDELYFDKSCKLNTYTFLRKSWKRGTVGTVPADATYRIAEFRDEYVLLDELDGPTVGIIWVKAATVEAKIGKGRISVTESE